MVIRAAYPTDAPAMGRVIVETFLAAHQGMMPEEAWNKRKAEWTSEVSAQNWERALQGMAQDLHCRDCIYVAEDESAEIVGVAMGVPSETRSADGAEQIGEVCVLYVHPCCQRQGIGRQLVKAIATQLAQQGMSMLHIAVLKANAPARRFYEALGAQLVSEREIDEEGVLLPGVVYGWTDITVLITMKRKMRHESE